MLLGQPGQHPGPRHAVDFTQRRQGLLEQPDQGLVDVAWLDPRAAEAEGGAGQQLWRLDRRRNRGRLPERVTRRGLIAGPHLRLTQGEQHLTALCLIGR